MLKPWGCYCCNDTGVQSSARLEVTALRSQTEASPGSARGRHQQGHSKDESSGQVGGQSVFFLPSSTEDFLEFTISVEKGPQLEKVGLEISRAPTFLKVKKVTPGLIEEHNKKNPHEAILENDAIVAVNGQSGRYDTLLHMISQHTKLDLTIRRAVYSEAVVAEFEPANVASEDAPASLCQP